MDDKTIVFLYEQIELKIQSKSKEYIKNIIKKFLEKAEKDKQELIFLYNGKILNEEIQLKDIINDDNEIKISVYDINENTNIIQNTENKKQSKDIICTKCGHNCLIDFKDYKIILNKCDNNHNVPNIFLNEFNNSQMINQSQIVCKECNNKKSEVYNLYLSIFILVLIW